MIDFYDEFLKELDSLMNPVIKKHLRKCARQREDGKGNGSLMDDWDSLTKGYKDALDFILKHHSKEMHIAGMLKHCDYKKREEDE